VTPVKNSALGLTSRIAIGKKITWELDAAGSVITEDVRTPVLVNDDLRRFSSGLFTPRIGTRALFAGNTSLKWGSKHLSLRINYKEVEPGYRSLGAFYQQTDVRAVTVEPGLRLAKGKLRLGGSYGLQQDNIRLTKVTTSVRRIGSGRISWSPSRTYGLDASYSNYGIAQEAGLNALNDTFRVAQANRNITIAQRIMLMSKLRSWSILLAGGYQELEDLNPFGTFARAENQVVHGNLHLSRIRTRDNLMLGGGLNASRNSTAAGEFMLIGPSLSFSRPLAKKKLMVSLSGSYNQAYRDGEEAGTTINANHTLQFNAGKAHRFQLTITALQNRTTFVATRQFTEVRLMGGYVLTFQTKS